MLSKTVMIIKETTHLSLVVSFMINSNHFDLFITNSLARYAATQSPFWKTLYEFLVNKLLVSPNFINPDHYSRMIDNACCYFTSCRLIVDFSSTIQPFIPYMKALHFADSNPNV